MGPLVRSLRRLIAPITRTRGFRVIAPRALPPAERLLKRLTRGRIVVSGILVPSLVLHTTGAKSGEPRTSTLMYAPDGKGGAIIAGTNFARGNHPGWTANLIAHPEAEVDVRGRRHRVHAERIPEEERNPAWTRLEAQWPGYRMYERESGRVVRLFRLTTDTQPTPFIDRSAGR